MLTPILAMKPSQRQKQMASYRLHAKAKGFMIGLAELPYVVRRDNAWDVQNAAAYRLLLDKEDAAASKPWYLFRNREGQWLDEFEEPISDSVQQQLSGLPDDCLMIAREPRAIVAWWLEKGDKDQLDKMVQLLLQWKTFHPKK